MRHWYNPASLLQFESALFFSGPVMSRQAAGVSERVCVCVCVCLNALAFPERITGAGLPGAAEGPEEETRHKHPSNKPTIIKPPWPQTPAIHCWDARKWLLFSANQMH